MPAAWAGELIRHSNRQSVQSRDTAAIFLVCMVEWVGLEHNKDFIAVMDLEPKKKPLKKLIKNAYKENKLARDILAALRE
jgi:hypothetical protein